MSPDTPPRHKSRIGPRASVGVVVRVTGILSVMILLNGEDRLELSPAPPGRPTLASHFTGAVTVNNVELTISLNQFWDTRYEVDIHYVFCWMLSLLFIWADVKPLVSPLTELWPTPRRSQLQQPTSQNWILLPVKLPIPPPVSSQLLRTALQHIYCLTENILGNMCGTKVSEVLQQCCRTLHACITI